MKELNVLTRSQIGGLDGNPRGCDMEAMTLWGGLYRNVEVPVLVRPLGCGAGEITCRECDGSGIWTVLPIDGSIRCVTCKGTGKVLISIA
jgi:hypothetical protein